MKIKKTTTFFTLFVVFCQWVNAATITVGSDSTDKLDLASPDGICQLREAIINANNDDATYADCTAGSGSDTIILQSHQTYNLELVGTGEDSSLTGDLDITDPDGLTITKDPNGLAGSTVIDAGSLIDDRIFHLKSNGNLTLEDITLQYGHVTTTTAEGAGAVLAIEGDGAITISNCILVNNAAHFEATGFNVVGGIISTISGTPSLAINNTYIGFNTITTDIASTGNLQGGILYAENFSNITINNTQITSNNIQSMNIISGGILFVANGESLEINNSSLSDNTVLSNAAASFSIGGIVKIADTNSLLDSSLVSGNQFELSSSEAYGTIFYSSDTPSAKDLQILNSTITGNTVTTSGGQSYGGALDLGGSEADIKIEFSTITNNNVGFEDIAAFGGGIFYNFTSDNASLLMKASFLSGNTSLTNGPDCYKGGIGSINLSSSGFNLIGDSTDCNYIAAGSDVTEGTATGLALLNDNGGPTWTLSNSSSTSRDTVIDCTQIDGVTSVETDQRGAPRYDGMCDVGAFESGSFYTDSDGDSFGDPLSVPTAEFNSTSVTNGSDCNDSDIDINPLATDLCDGIDNDCDGNTDEDFANLGDACSVGTGVCENTGNYVCNATLDATECNVTAGDGETEICDDSLDNDCDGSTDSSDSDCLASSGDDDDTGGSTAGDDDDDDDDDGGTAGDDDDDDDDTTSNGGGCQLNTSHAISTSNTAFVMAFIATIGFVLIRRKKGTELRFSSKSHDLKA